MKRIARAACFVVATLATAGAARTSSAEPPNSSEHVIRPERAADRGIAVIALGNSAREEAFALARAVYASRLRPPSLDEVRARVLAGGTPPKAASRELRDLAEIRAGLSGDDAASRRLLAGMAQQFGVEGLLVVKIVEGPKGDLAPAPSPDSPPGGGGQASEDPGNGGARRAVEARLFLTAAGDFDAARYTPDPDPKAPAAWKSIVTSLEGRFPPAARAPGPPAATQPSPLLRQEPTKSAPFYASGWFWGALGGAALIGGAFYFVSRDTGSDSIHLQMRVPK